MVPFIRSMVPFLRSMVPFLAPTAKTTKIPQEDLKKKLKEIVNRAFKGGACKYIQVSKYEARWAAKGNKVDTYSCEDVENLIDVVFDNAVFIVGKKIYRQTIGMVMGVDPAPPAADFYLHADEARYMRKLTKENYHEASESESEVVICRTSSDV